MLSRRGLIYALFFGSGASGLVYEVAWVRELGLVFGNTVQSAALVTAVFMCGLGGGSYAAGVYADRRRERLVASYGACEIAIGILALILAFVLPRLTSISASISSYVLDAEGRHVLSLASYLLRYALAAAL